MEDYKIIAYSIDENDLRIFLKYQKRSSYLFAFIMLLISLVAVTPILVLNILEFRGVESIPAFVGCGLVVVIWFVICIVRVNNNLKKTKHHFYNSCSNGVIEYVAYLMPEYIGLENKTTNNKFRFDKTEIRRIKVLESLLIVILGKRSIMLPRNEDTERYFNVDKKK